MYARFTTTVICNAIIQNSIQTCNLEPQDSRPVCADTCVWSLSYCSMSEHCEADTPTRPNSLRLRPTSSPTRTSAQVREVMRRPKSAPTSPTARSRTSRYPAANAFPAPSMSQRTAVTATAPSAFARTAPPAASIRQTRAATMLMPRSAVPALSSRPSRLLRCRR